MTRHAARLWDAAAGIYDLIFIPLDGLLFRRWRRRAMAEIEAWPLLEAGAGTGLNFRFYPHDARGVAIDFSYGMLRRAASRADRPRGVHLVVADVQRLPFPEERFASSLATLVFCGVDSPEEGLGELRRTVKAGGRVVLLEHVRPKGILGPLFDFLNIFSARLFCDHLNRRTERAVAAWFEITALRETGCGVLQLLVSRR